MFTQNVLWCLGKPLPTDKVICFSCSLYQPTTPKLSSAQYWVKALPMRHAHIRCWEGGERACFVVDRAAELRVGVSRGKATLEPSARIRGSSVGRLVCKLVT